ncbi:hypothetical protein SAMN05444285_10916 [Draconibacterium orientale]|jgi:hypothetical protein|uniref:Uncharacterized protein n=1 Tax=Draconibacterium orientale TaxID=1168034 RepID=A0A1I0D3G2_9BACT|nr:hypothetical protein SAMN05444285_10916 [Draconibacterium orientale]
MTEHFREKPERVYEKNFVSWCLRVEKEKTQSRKATKKIQSSVDGAL